MATMLEAESSTQLDASEALSAATTAAWRWEIGSPSVDWSAGAARVLGVPGIVLRSPDLLLEAVHPDDLALVWGPASDSWRTGEPVSARFRIRLAGEVRWFDVSGQIFHGSPGQAPYATGTARDVTESREAEEALVDALREAETVLEQLHAGVGEWDAWTDTVRVFSGPSGLGIAGNTPREVPLDVILNELDDGSRSRLRDSLSRALSADEPFTLEIKVRGEDAEIRRVVLKGGVVPAPPGRVGLVALLLD